MTGYIKRWGKARALHLFATASAIAMSDIADAQTGAQPTGPVEIAANDTAFAAPSPDPSSADSIAQDSASGGAIVVTARRRRESAQDVPVALSVVGALQLQQTGNYTLTQVQQLVPSLQVYSFNPRNTNINIRGLGSNVALTNDGLENGVGFYIDNVYYGRAGQSQFDLVDLQQIEVLRGPQGTLFGKNTTAGAINITSRKPSYDPEFSGEATIGDYGYTQVRASASGPIIPGKLAIRLSAADTERRGFLYNVTQRSRAQDYSNQTFRGQLLFDPTDDFSVRIIGDYSRQKQNYVLNVFAGYIGTYDDGVVIPNNFAARAARFPGYNFPALNPFDRRGEADSHYQANMEGYGVSGQIDAKLGGATITSITAYRWWDWYPANDGDSTSLPITTKAQQVNHQRQFSQEFRLASNGNDRLDYVVGAYYFWQVVRGYGTFEYGSAAALWNLPTVPAAIGNAALNGFLATSTSTPTTKSYAAFGQTDFKFTPDLILTTGLRFSHEQKYGSFTESQIAGPSLAGLAPAAQAAAIGIRNQFNPIVLASDPRYNPSFDDNSLSGLATLTWKFHHDALIYATYSRGSKSGGLNLTVLPAGVSPEVKPERVNNYEVGLKSQFLDRKVTFNAAAYWTEISQYQTAITEVAAGTVTTRQYIANIPKVRSRGLEGDLVVAPSRWFSANAAVSYTEATYRDYKNAPQAVERLDKGAIQDLSGTPLPGVPEFIYTLGTDASAPLGSLGGRDLELYGHADYSHRSSFNTSSTNSRLAQVPGYGLLNARVGFRTADGLLDVSIWAKNLTDQNYFQTLSPANTGIVTALIGEPRTFGVTLRTKL